jgi:hypothetical protein
MSCLLLAPRRHPSIGLACQAGIGTHSSHSAAGMGSPSRLGFSRRGHVANPPPSLGI